MDGANAYRYRKLSTTKSKLIATIAMAQQHPYDIFGHYSWIQSVCSWKITATKFVTVRIKKIPVVIARFKFCLASPWASHSEHFLSVLDHTLCLSMLLKVGWPHAILRYHTNVQLNSTNFVSRGLHLVLSQLPLFL